MNANDAMGEEGGEKKEKDLVVQKQSEEKRRAVCITYRDCERGIEFVKRPRAQCTR